MTKPTANYMPQLDSLRALAVFAVMIHHWAPGLLGFGPWGELGVRCFFVLSGFLITGILLGNRAAVDSGRSTLRRQIGNFYVRRSLRIFPIYYLTLLVGAFLGMNVLQQTFWWHAAYASNIYFAIWGDPLSYISHLWSLSVEEQFYLFWPLLLMLLPLRRLPALFVVCIAGAVILRAGLAATLGPQHIALRVLLPASLDSLVMGAVLAWLFSPHAKMSLPVNELLKHGFPIATAGFTAVCALHYFEMGGPVLAIFGPLVEAFFFATIIGKCALGMKGLAGRLLNLSALQYLGRISYGLYLYHMFAGYVAGMIADQLGLTVPGAGAGRFALLFAMSVIAAAISHRFIERPFNQLKRFFPSDASQPRPARQSAKEVSLQNLPQTAR